MLDENDITTSHMVILNCIRQLSQYDMLDIWDEETRKLISGLADDLHHHAELEANYYKRLIGRAVQPTREKIFPREKEDNQT
ncbi:MAG: hypothetical protein J5908_02775 [Selenomonas sp.]|jgi:hypothetical protein|nr:hypothetical protein [Selenomonas sp.]